MMSALDKKRMKMELIQIQAGRASLEFRVEERLDEIERLKEHIAVSQAKEDELADKIKNS